MSTKERKGRQAASPSSTQGSGQRSRRGRSRSATRDAVVNSAQAYDVRVEPVAPVDGASYWRATRVRHLGPEENRGKHAVYVDVVDENGERVQDPALRIGWTWEGRSPDESAPPRPLDKPENEPAGNVDVFSGQHVQVWIEGDGRPSDRVSNLHTKHPDEAAPTGELWNSIGHHSFHVVFQRTVAEVDSATEPVVEPTGETDEEEPVVPTAPVPGGGQNGEEKPAEPPPQPTSPTPPTTRPPHYPEYIFGIHEAGGEEHMLSSGRTGWVLELAEIGLDGANAAARTDFGPLADQGLGVMVRINHGYGSTGTLPLPEHYPAFAQACKAYVARTNGCHLWIIGNEPNHENERPQGQAITPANYVDAYSQCRATIRSLPGHEADQVLVAGPAPWNILTQYPGNEYGDWVQYFADTLARLPDGGCDGFAIHTYTHSLSVDQIRGDFFHEDVRFKHRRNEFRTYIDFMRAIPPRFRNLPVFITEADPTEPSVGWQDGKNVGWVCAAYEEIARWNSDPGNQPIQAMLLYRWPDPAHHGQHEWSIANRPGIVEDFVEALKLEPASRFQVRLPDRRPAVAPVAPVDPGRPIAPDSSLVPIPPIYTNQQLIDAFFFAARDLAIPDYQTLVTKAGLNVNVLAQARESVYAGPGLHHLPNLKAEEQSALRRELLMQLLKTIRWAGLVNAPAGLNMRAGPTTDQPVVTLLSHETMVQVLDEQNGWLFVFAEGKVGYVATRYVLPRIDPATVPTTVSPTTVSPTEPQPVGPTVVTTSPATGELAPSAADQLLVPPDATPGLRVVVNTWNQYGALILAEADRLGIDVATAVAILAAESSGNAFGPDGRMIIRFENHLFHHYWGKENQPRFDRHFAYDATTSWQGHRWRAEEASGWQDCHTSQEMEWRIFEFARALDERAAICSISMGAPQIMGFNHASIGYGTPQEMFQAFQADAGNQLRSLFRFIEVNGLVDAVRGGDYLRFATTYNGPGQPAVYANIIQGYVDAFRTVRPPAPVGDRRATPPTPTLPPPPSQLPIPAPIPGKPLAETDPELYRTWRRHMERGFENNQTMFDQILRSFMNPYWTTVWMYRLLFGLGFTSFIVAVVLSVATGDNGFAWVFGGISAVTLLGYLWNRPLQALEENIQFITWLGIVYNSYWTRLLYMSDSANVQRELEDATDDAVAKIKELIAAHAESSGKRPAWMPERGDGSSPS